MGLGQNDRTEPWGWKVTIHVYGSGKMPGSGSMLEASSLASELLCADDFVGVDAKVVKKQPNAQVAT